MIGGFKNKIGSNNDSVARNISFFKELKINKKRHTKRKYNSNPIEKISIL